MLSWKKILLIVVGLIVLGASVIGGIMYFSAVESAPEPAPTETVE